MTAAIDHPQPWTLAEVMALPEDGVRYELIDGVLIVNPPPTPRHQLRAHRLHRLLEEAAKAASVRSLIVEGVGIALPDDNLLIPDLVVLSADAPSINRTLLDPYDVQLAVEVVSPGSRRRDRSVKPYMYAEAGIPHFWRVETDNYRGRTKDLPVVVRHELVGLAEYKMVEEIGAGERLRVDEPFTVSFDPAALLD